MWKEKCSLWFVSAPVQIIFLSSPSLFVLSRFSHVQLFATLWTIAHQTPPSAEILQARILGWVAMPSSGDLPDLGMEPAALTSPSWVGRLFTTSTTWEVLLSISRKDMSQALLPSAFQRESANRKNWLNPGGPEEGKSQSLSSPFSLLQERQWI